MSMPLFREICCYIIDAPIQKLIAVLGRKVHCFDVATSEWQHFLTLHRNINGNNLSSSTFIGPNTIFVCGGGAVPSTCKIDSATVVEGDGRVAKLPHMSTQRLNPGLAWDLVRHTIYVFGGYDSSGPTYSALRTSEMFLSQWSPLPDMHRARIDFNPCWDSSLLYLCGGYGTNSVETYDPQSNTFTLQDFTLPSDSFTTAVEESGNLIVISENHISKVQQGRFTCHSHHFYTPWSSCAPQVSGGVVYIVNVDGNCYSCFCIDLTTGELLKKVSLV